MIYLILFILLENYVTINIQQIIFPQYGCNKLPKQFISHFFNSVTFFQSNSFIKFQDQFVRKKYCQENCPPNCCMDSNCKEKLNANGDEIDPSNHYYISTGGISENIELRQCLTEGECESLAQNQVFYGNLQTGNFYALNVEKFPQIFLHASLTLTEKKTNIKFLYFFGGKNLSCNKNIILCSKLYRFPIPDSPINLSNFQIVVEEASSENTKLFGLIAHSMIYNKELNKIFIYGGVKIVDQISIQNQDLWSYSLTNQFWEKINPQLTEQLIINIDDQKNTIQYQIEQPQKTIFPLLIIKENYLIVLGGFVEKNSFSNFEYYQKTWQLDLTTFFWKDITPSYFFYNLQLGFTNYNLPNYFQLNKDSSLNFLHYLFLSEFSHLIQMNVKGDFIVIENQFYIIQSNKIYSNIKKNEIFCQQKNRIFYEKLGWNFELFCSGNGECIGDQCICNPDFTESDCSKKICYSKCSDESQKKNPCLMNFPQSYCSCFLQENLGGIYCSKKFCVNDCSFKGTCDYNQGICKCNANFYGTDCSILEIRMNQQLILFKLKDQNE